jgi:hypothetical protein
MKANRFLFVIGAIVAQRLIYHCRRNRNSQ